ncbi:MAG: carboxypeptidase-like regulatory domain-containing protein [Planctomycetota bacterium]
MIKRCWTCLTEYFSGLPRKSSQDFASEISEELSFHLQQRTQDFMDQGLSPEEAEAAAHAKFGDAGRIASECHSASLTGLAWIHRVHMGVTLCLGGAVLVLGWNVATGQMARHANQMPPGIARMLHHDWSGGISGRVLDDQGRPIEDANVLIAVKTWPDESYFQRAYATKTTPDGRYSIRNVRPEDDVYEVQVTIVASDHAMRSQYKEYKAGQSSNVDFVLPPAERVVVEVRDRAGRALAGAEVFPSRRTDVDGHTDFVYHDTAKPITRTTDDSGLVELTCYRPGDSGELMVRDQDRKWRRVNLKVPPDERVLIVEVES